MAKLKTLRRIALFLAVVAIGSLVQAPAFALGNDASLSSVAASSPSPSGVTPTISPVFDPAETNYLVAAPYVDDVVCIQPTSTDPNATISYAKNGAYISDCNAELMVGDNTLTITVTAEDAVTSQTYTFVITRAAAPSTDARLSALSAIGEFGLVTPDTPFDPEVLSYTASVPFAETNICIDAPAEDVNAQVVISLEGIALTDCHASPLALGPNTVTVVVTAQDGTTSVAYDWVIVRDQAAPCVDYSQTPEASNLFLNPDGTVIGCEMSAGQEDVTPTDWAKQFHSPYGGWPTLPTFDTRLGFHCDDCSVGGDGYINFDDQSQNGIPLGFDVNFYGQTFNSVFMNSNGSLTFGVPSTCYNFPLATMILCNEPESDAPKIIAAAIAPLAVDVYNFDTSKSDLYYWGRSTIGGKPAFVGTWIKTTGYDGASDKFATFQVAIVSDATEDPVTSGDATVIMNYGSTQMTYDDYGGTDYSSCTDPDCMKLGAGLGLYAPDDQGNWVMSLTPLTGDSGTIYDTQYFANVRDTAAHPLISDSLNSNVLGRYVYTFTNTIHPFIASATSKPIDVTATRVAGSASELDASWSAPTDLGGANVINYTVNYRPTGTTGQWSTSTTPGTSLRISGLTSLTNYDVYVTANNGVGDSPASDTVSAQTNPSTNADLQSLSATGTSSVTLTPTFDSAILAYTSQVPYSVSSACLSDTLSDMNATVVVKNGTSVIADCNANLLVGVNTLTFVITAQDGVATKTYTWVITREADSTATPTPKSNGKETCSVSSAGATFEFGTSGPISNATKRELKKMAAHSKSAHFEITGCAGMRPGIPVKFVRALAMSRAKRIANYLVALGVNRRLITLQAAVVPFGITPKAKILQQLAVT